MTAGDVGGNPRGGEEAEALTTYNLEDCLALKRVAEFVQVSVSLVWASSGSGRTWEGTDCPQVGLVHDLDKAANISKRGAVRGHDRLYTGLAM